MEEASVICRFWKETMLRGASGAIRDSELRVSAVEPRWNTGPAERGENKEWQKWNMMNACRNLKVPAFAFSGTWGRVLRVGAAQDAQSDFRLNKSLCRDVSGMRAFVLEPLSVRVILSGQTGVVSLFGDMHSRVLSLRSVNLTKVETVELRLWSFRVI